MILSLIGMSGAGKTYLAKKLEKNNFLRHSIDELIEKKINHQLELKGISGVAKWMGQPNDPLYKYNSQKYLNLEEEAMWTVFNSITENSPAQNIVIDTTGSIIYLNQKILKKLTLISTILYLKTPDEEIEQMRLLYLKSPKPVIWGKSFTIKNNESFPQALSRCYPKLLRFRQKHYQKLANITLDSTHIKNPSFTIEKFISKITRLNFFL